MRVNYILVILILSCILSTSFATESTNVKKVDRLEEVVAQYGQQAERIIENIQKEHKQDEKEQVQGPSKNPDSITNTIQDYASNVLWELLDSVKAFLPASSQNAKVSKAETQNQLIGTVNTIGDGLSIGQSVSGDANSGTIVGTGVSTADTLANSIGSYLGNIPRPNTVGNVIASGAQSVGFLITGDGNTVAKSIGSGDLTIANTFAGTSSLSETVASFISSGFNLLGHTKPKKEGLEQDQKESFGSVPAGPNKSARQIVSEANVAGSLKQQSPAILESANQNENQEAQAINSIQDLQNNQQIEQQQQDDQAVPLSNKLVRVVNVEETFEQQQVNKAIYDIENQQEQDEIDFVNEEELDAINANLEENLDKLQTLIEARDNANQEQQQNQGQAAENQQQNSLKQNKQAQKSNAALEKEIADQYQLIKEFQRQQQEKRQEYQQQNEDEFIFEAADAQAGLAIEQGEQIQNQVQQEQQNELQQQEQISQQLLEQEQQQQLVEEQQ